MDTIAWADQLFGSTRKSCFFLYRLGALFLSHHAFLRRSLHDPSKSDLAIQHTTHMVHDCIRRLPPSTPHIDSFVTVFDLSGYGMGNRSASTFAAVARFASAR